jgi:hypothetical protein
MRKLVLIIVAAAFAVTMANVTHAAPFANSSALRDAGDDVALTDKVAYVCTHWWNGYWHPYARCFYRAPLYYSYGCCYGPRVFFRGGGGFRFHGGRGHGRRSDIQLKHDIQLLGHLDNGLGFYRFSYNGSDKAYVGVMAQEVQTVIPQAVARGRDGYLRVDYDLVGVTFQSYEDWRASGSQIPAGGTDSGAPRNEHGRPRGRPFA